MRLAAGTMAMLVAMTGTALAQAADVDANADRSTRVLVMDEVGLDGRLEGPTGARLGVRTPPRFGTLVRLRTDFQPELERSTTAL